MKFFFRTLVGALLFTAPVMSAKGRAVLHSPHHFGRHMAQPRVKEARVGWASWYGKANQGRRMADGHRFNRFHFTAASRTLPLGTKIRVLNLQTGLDTVVTITDPGASCVLTPS
jgi:rare lipoprotein A (peptidoglycan hydrolase)